jgi:hypothetical protein
MSQPQPPGQPALQPQPPWPQAGQDPFADQGQSPFVPGSVPLGYGPPVRVLQDEPGMRWVLPVGTSGWAIAAGYFGLFSLLCFPAQISIVLGLVAIWHLRKNPRLSGWGRAIFGLAMGIVFTLIPVIAVIAGVMAK